MKNEDKGGVELWHRKTGPIGLQSGWNSGRSDLTEC